MKKIVKKISIKKLLKRLEKLNLKVVSSAELLQFVVDVRSLDRQLKNSKLKTGQVRDAFSCTLFQDKLEKEMSSRKLPDPDSVIYAARGMFEEIVKTLDDDVLAFFKGYFDSKADVHDDFRVLSALIHTERMTNRSCAINGGFED